MFLLTSKKSDYFTDHLINLLSNNIFYLTKNKTKNIFKKIYIENSAENINISMDTKKINYKKPIIYKSIHSGLFSFLSNTFYKFENFTYYPLLQKIENQNIDIKLTYTHSIILNNLLLNKDGTEKLELYNLLWPNDKNIHLNKLDTHLTNLKNLFEKEFDYIFNYSSKQSLLRLSID